MGLLIAGVLLIEDHSSAAGGPEPYGLGPVLPAEGEAELAEGLLDGTGVLRLDLDEIEPGRARRPWQSDETSAADCGRAPASGLPLRHLVFQPGQRATGVGGGPGHVGLPEYVVENLQRQRA